MKNQNRGLSVALQTSGEPEQIHLLSSHGQAEHAWTWTGGERLSIEVIKDGDVVGYLELWTSGRARVVIDASWSNRGVRVRLTNTDTGDNASMMAG